MVVAAWLLQLGPWVAAAWLLQLGPCRNIQLQFPFFNFARNEEAAKGRVGDTIVSFVFFLAKSQNTCSKHIQTHTHKNDLPKKGRRRLSKMTMKGQPPQ